MLPADTANPSLTRIEVFTAENGVIGGAPPATVEIVYWCCAKTKPAADKKKRCVTFRHLQCIVPMHSAILRGLEPGFKPLHRAESKG